MSETQFQYSFFISLVAIAIYIAMAWFYRQTPDLTRALLITTSCTSTVAAVLAGVLTYSAAPEQLGVLREHKAGVVTGTMALIWISITATYKSLMHPKRCALKTV